MSGSAFAVTHHAFSSGAGRTSDGNGSHASTLKSPSYTKSVSWQHYPIILLDMMEADKKLIHYWQDTLSRKNNNIKILLLNTPEDYPYRDIENWPHINGVFYAMEDQERVVNGLQGVLRGECYFTQKLASYLITHSGNYRYNSTESALLTHREKEILNKLRIGASNNEIARSLFISENTVKTHLYNLFKKIAVKNRTQAVSWANDNLRR